MPTFIPEVSRAARVVGARVSWARTQCSAAEPAAKLNPPGTGVASEGGGPEGSMPREEARVRAEERSTAVEEGTDADKALASRKEVVSRMESMMRVGENGLVSGKRWESGDDIYIQMYDI